MAQAICDADRDMKDDNHPDECVTLGNDMRQADQVNHARLRRHQALLPAERIAACIAVQQQAFAVLHASPHAFAEFIRRNHQSRRVAYVNGKWQPLCPSRSAYSP